MALCVRNVRLDSRFFLGAPFRKEPEDFVVENGKGTGFGVLALSLPKGRVNLHGKAFVGEGVAHLAHVRRMG